MHDLVIRGAKIVDGTGSTPFSGDVAVDGGCLMQVGGRADRAKREIAAEGCIVTPGFVDIHTHYDAQLHWDPYLSSSCWHGVTSVVFGNCGVGFAPATPQVRDSLIELMHTVEAIPADSLRAGIEWGWETFPEFLDFLEGREFGLNIGAQVPHAAVRASVMGERGMENRPATEDDLTAMSAVVRDSMQAGALGFTGTRTRHHRSRKGQDAPGYGLPVDEVIRLSRAAAEAGCGGVVGINVDLDDDIDAEFSWLRRLRRACGLPVFFLLNQWMHAPEKWTAALQGLRAAADDGVPLTAQFSGRPITHLLGLTTERHPFSENPSYVAIASLPLAARVARLRDPAFRATLLSEPVTYRSEVTRSFAQAFERMFRLGDPPDYEPPPERSVAAMARAAGKSPRELALDIMLESDGKELLLFPLTNYASGDFSAIWEMLNRDNMLLGLGDGGAHISMICDSSTPTYMLSHWARDRSRGPRLSLEDAVSRQTSRTARFYGLDDRGTLAPGMRADLNVIDFERLQLGRPEVVLDQPAGARRLVQRAQGYVATLVAGIPTFENGEATGSLPGTLIRGRRTSKTLAR